MILVDHEWSIPFVSFLEYFFVFHKDSYFVFRRGEHVIPNEALSKLINWNKDIQGVQLFLALDLITALSLNPNQL